MKIDGNNNTRIWSTATSTTRNDDRKALGIVRNSGQVSPQSGYWQMSNISTNAVVKIKKGTVLPYYQGQPVTWQLKSYDFSNESKG